jgi:hypothetical protein
VRRTKANVIHEEGKMEKEKDGNILSNPTKEANSIDRKSSSMITECSSMQTSVYNFFVGFNPSIVLYEHKI